LDKFIERCHSLPNMEKPLNPNIQRIKETFFGNEKLNTHHGYQEEEGLQRPLAAQALSFKGQTLGPYQNMDIETNVGLESLLPSALTTTFSDGGTTMPTTDKITALSINIQRSKEPAKVSESALTQVSTQKSPESRPLKNVEAIADKVYRLMQRDLILERERASRLGG
jgi:hypothetical protein